MNDPDLADPFRDARQAKGVLVARFGDETMPMILGYRAVRDAAKAWETFSSDAPFRVPIPSEEGVRTVRQLPIEADPPVHTAFRELLRPVFQQPQDPAYQARIDALVAELIDDAASRPKIEIVRDFALPLQSRALTYLLGMPEAEAATWIGWGTHVFHDGDDAGAKGSTLDRYIRQALADADPAGGEDFFSRLRRATVEGRRLSDDEMVGISNLVFAGGRDTVINAVSRVVAYFAEHRAALDEIAPDLRRVAFATEELVRVISPLTHIGRVCPRGAEVSGHKVEADARVSLCWASANYDAQVFEAPETIRLDRAPNPHVAFGSGVHNCLGAPQARAILRSLIRQLGERTTAIEILEAVRQYETQADYHRWVGFEALTVRMTGRSG